MTWGGWEKGGFKSQSRKSLANPQGNCNRTLENCKYVQHLCSCETSWLGSDRQLWAYMCASVMCKTKPGPSAHTSDVRDSTRCLPSGRLCHSDWSAPKAVQSSHKNLPSLTSLSWPPFPPCWLRYIQTGSVWSGFLFLHRGKIRWGKTRHQRSWICVGWVSAAATCLTSALR